jgi:hypothetical protein
VHRRVQQQRVDVLVLRQPRRLQVRHLAPQLQQLLLLGLHAEQQRRLSLLGVTRGLARFAFRAAQGEQRLRHGSRLRLHALALVAEGVLPPFQRRPRAGRLALGRRHLLELHLQPARRG